MTGGRIVPRLAVLVVGIAGLLYGLAAFSIAWPAVTTPPMAIFAHHGDLDHWPENTLEGIVAASRTAVDGVEFDVQRSSEGTWWLAHDEVLDVTTDGSGVMDALSDAELSALTIDGGPTFQGQHGLRLPRLADALAGLADYRGKIMVDIKDPDPVASGDVARRLVEAGRPDALVICLSVGGASEVKAVDRRFTTIVLTGDTWHPDVDAVLLDAARNLRWPATTIADAGGTLGMFISTDDFAQPEGPFLDAGRRMGVSFVISNHLQAALEWAGR